MSALKKQKQHVSKEDVRQALSSRDGFGENTGRMPPDLMLEILSRSPAKSVGRFRCVSKNWNSLLHDPYSTSMFMTKSSTRPRLIFTFQAEGKWSFFSSPEYLISDQNSNLVVVDNHMGVPRDYNFGVCVPVSGLMCSKDEWVLSGRKDVRMTICNPTTSQVTSLPKVRSRRKKVTTYIGYDPVEKQYKVLCMTIREKPFLFKAEEYQVLTLGTGKMKWRMIECSIAHYPRCYPHHSEICINGMLYYLAMNHKSRNNMIVCFDVNQEKFNFIMNNEQDWPSTLLNYKGKLGGISPKPIDFIDGEVTSFELWVIDDIEQHTWSKHTYILPPMWKELVAEARVYIVGMIGASEIVFSPFELSNPFYIFHLDIERNSVKRVEIQGIGPVTGQDIYTFINHVENVNLIV